MLRLQESGAEVDTNVKKYLNRLSDYFFVLSRKLNADAGVEDVEWYGKRMMLYGKVMRMIP